MNSTEKADELVRALNQTLLLPWTDDDPSWTLRIITTVTFSLTNMEVLWVYYVIIPLSLYTRTMRHILSEVQSLQRRFMINTILRTSPKARRAALEDIWQNLDHKVYGVSMFGFRCRLLSQMKRYLLWWFYQPQVEALSKLLECKTDEALQQKILYLAFIDATRLGSKMTPELRQHLTSVLGLYDQLKDANMNDRIRLLQSDIPPEVYLLRQGELARDKDWDLDTRRREDWYFYPTLQRGSESLAEWWLFEGDNLDFVHYGPRDRRIRRVLSRLARVRGCGYPVLEFVALFYYPFIWANVVVVHINYIASPLYG